MELARIAGLTLDPWQEFVLRDALREDDAGRWSAFEVGLVLARQNGKGAVLEARELAGLFLFGEQLILHSAHEFKTAGDAFRRVLGLIEGTADLSSRVLRVHRAAGNEGIELKSGARLRFVARTGGSGRGFSADLIVLDESYNLPEHAMAALMPTLSARPNPQIWYTSSAVNAEIHPNGLMLARVRRRGLAGDDPSLAYFEWSVDEAAYESDPRAVAADRESWRQANPGLGIRISPQHVERERRSMGTKTFAVERLSVGDWPPEPVDEDPQVIDASLWEELADRTWEPHGAPRLALDMTPDRSTAAVGLAARDGEGVPHVEVVDQRPGTGWIIDRLVELQRKYPAPVLVDPGGPAGGLMPALAQSVVRVQPVTAREYAQACGGFYDAALERKLRHSNQAVLNNALSVAMQRPLGEAWAWDRRNTSANIAPLVAVTLALFGVAGSAAYDVLDSVR